MECYDAMCMEDPSTERVGRPSEFKRKSDAARVAYGARRLRNAGGLLIAIALALMPFLLGVTFLDLPLGYSLGLVGSIMFVVGHYRERRAER